MRLSRATRRTGFTLVEMLVATALILFIMAIMAEALGAGSKTFANMRTAGDLQNKLRSASTIMRRDLSLEHFGPPYGSNRGGPRVRDQRLDLPGWRPPYAGYMEIVQTHPSLFEPSVPGQYDQIEPPAVPPPTPNSLPDAEGLFSTRARTHWIKFTVRLPDGPPSELHAAAYHPRLAVDPQVNMFPALAPMVYTRWAEIHYFLRQTPNLTGGSGLPLHTLHRRIRLLPAKSHTLLITAGEANQIIADMAQNRYPDMISPILSPAPPPFPAGMFLAMVPGPEALNTGAVGRIPSGAVHPTGDDILLQDVISFEIKAAWFSNPLFNNQQTGGFAINHPVYGPLGPSTLPHTMGQGNSDEPFADLRPSVLQGPPTQPAFQRRFDTGLQSDVVDWDQQNANWNAAALTGGFLTPSMLMTPPLQNPVPSRINVRVLQIKLRIWDPRAEQARQVTIVQEI
jgi:prepilin-type N-terminal cleavage/methylation domain-containing protein